MVGETVKVKTDYFPDGFIIINADEFDPETMEVFAEDETGDEPKGEAPAPTLDDLMKSTKAQLLEMAADAGIEIKVPDDVTKAQIAEQILAKQAENGV